MFESDTDEQKAAAAARIQANQRGRSARKKLQALKEAQTATDAADAEVASAFAKEMAALSEAEAKEKERRAAEASSLEAAAAVAAAAELAAAPRKLLRRSTRRLQRPRWPKQKSSIGLQLLLMLMLRPRK